MNIGNPSFIFFLVFFEHCIHVTLSASDERDKNLALVKRGKLPWERFLKSARSKRETVKRKQDEKGKAIVSSPAEAETSTAGAFRACARWTNEQKEDLLRYYYGYQLMWFFKGTKGLRDWEKIRGAWSAKHGYIENKRLRTHARYLRRKMQDAVKVFDDHHSEGGVIPWTGSLIDDLMKIYYATEAGEKSKHGERMLAEWVRMGYPNYERMTPGYLLNLTETMIEKAMLENVKLSSSSRQTNESGQNPIWKKDHDEFFEKLWQKYPRRMKNRIGKMYNDAVGKFEELKDVSPSRVYERARRFHDSIMRHKPKSGSTEKYVRKGDSDNFIVDGYINWKPHHDKYLLKLWNQEDRSKGLKIRFYQKALRKFSEIGELTTGQVYDHVKYLINKEQKFKNVETSNQESMRRTQVPYHHFIDDQDFPSSSQGMHHYHEYIASTSSNPGQSQKHPDLESSLNAFDFGGQSPDTNLKLR